MAFTGAEYWRGLLWALVVFNVGFPLFLMAWTVVPRLFTEGVAVLGAPGGGGAVPYFVTATIYTALVSGFVAVTFGGLAAYLLGLLLRSVGSRWLHRVAFLACGGVVAVVGLLLFGALLGDVSWMLMLMWPAALWAALSVWVGWEVTSRRALRVDAQSARRVEGVIRN